MISLKEMFLDQSYYVNDLLSTVLNSKLLLFAGDAKLHCSITNIIDMQEDLYVCIS